MPKPVLKSILTFAFILTLAFSAFAQKVDTIRLTLDDVVTMAKKNSISSMAAKNRLATAY